MEGNLTQDLHVFGVLLHYVTSLARVLASKN